MNHIKWITLIILAMMIGIASWHPLEVQSYLLHQLGTILMLVVLFYYNYKVKISTAAFILYCAFLAIHVVAAHYLYSYVPYNIWIQHWFNFDLNHFFGWQRNMFDRLVHFAYGFLLFPFFYQIYTAWLPTIKQQSKIALICIMWVMASSMFYELIEWWIAIGMSPEAAENYNGQQGDIWDAHKDMLLATIGSIVAWIILPKKLLNIAQ